MNTTEKNELIAKFLGYSTPHPDYPTASYWYKKGQPPLTILSFDSDWNLLMEVVKKIEFLSRESNMFGTFIFYGLGMTRIYCYKNEVRKHEIEAIGAQGINPTYDAIIKFITWYNQNK